MNPLFLLLGIFGSLGVLSSGSSTSSSTPLAASLPDPEPDSEPETAPDADPVEEAPSSTPPTILPSFAPVEVAVYLIDTRTNETVLQFTENTEISGDLVNKDYLAVIAVPAENIGSVRFDFNNGAVTRTESADPFALFGDRNGGQLIAPDDPLFTEAGTFSLAVQVFDGPNGTGTLVANEVFEILAAEPVAEEPEEPVAEEPEEPVVEEPEEPVAEEPVVEEPEEPVAEEPEEPVAEEPEEPEEEEPEEPIQGNVDDIDAPDQPGDSGSGADTDAIEIDGQTTVMSGRVSTLEAQGNDITGLKILSDVPNGHVTVNPDNTFAVVLTKTEFTGNQSFRYEATHSDGSTSVHTANLKVIPGEQDQGWGTGENHYMLATDENDNVIVEAGENHTAVYISGSNSALSLSDIAQAENMNVNDVTGEWLANHGGYGQSEGMALDAEAGMELWGYVTPKDSVNSNHLLIEKGYEYDLGRVLLPNTSGESPMNPIFFGAYGEGDKPIMTNHFLQNGEGGENVVVQGIHFQAGFKYQGYGKNVLLDDVVVTEDALVLMRIEGVTVRNSAVMDVHLEESRNGGDWDGSEDREQGFFGNFNEGILLENTFFDLNGWEIGYDPNHSGDYGQPPSQYNHNIYIGNDNSDVTVRDNITMRASSIGLMVRSGGFIEDNAIIDNNIGTSTLGGDYKGRGEIGQYSLLTDNVVTSGAHKVAEYTGGRPYGIDDSGKLTSLVDNIVTHLANPDDPSELDYKILTQHGLITDTTYYNDTIVWNWEGSKETSRLTELNAEDLDPDILNQTTIQRFTQQLLGDPDATIEDLADYLRAQVDGDIPENVDADTIIQYFQEGFGIDFDARDSATTLRFTPSDLAEGVRWDNRLNWDTEDLPGEVFESDSVDLGGNEVVYGSNTRIDSLEIGPDGELSLYGGRLVLDGGVTGDDAAHLNIEHTGQFWTEGGDADALDITVDGGRFLNSGAFSGASLKATGGQVILAADDAEYDVEDGDTLEVSGGAKVGFDGGNGGLAILDLLDDATTLFTVEDGELGSISEFRSGAYGDAPDVLSGIDLGNSALEIDLDGLSASQNGSMIELMSADELAGVFDDVDVSGLGGRNATIVVDYETDTVSLQLTNGSGNVSVQTIGEQNDVSAGQDALWAALTDGQGVFSDAENSAYQDEVDEFALAS